MEFKGFVLSAGFGTRLRPITDILPKPLVKLGKKTLINYGIELLKTAGVSEIGVNAHYKGELLKDYARKSNLAFFEEKELLGTGGYLLNLGDFFDKPLISVNCDTVFFGDKNLLDRLKNFFLSNKYLAVLVLAKRKDKSLTPIGGDNGKITRIGGDGDYFFTGLQILSPKIMPYVRTSIVDTYNLLIKEGLLGYVEFKGIWFDCGTLEGLINANLFLNEANDFFIYPGAKISDKVTVRRSVIYPGANVSGEGEILNCIVYENAYLNLKKEKIENKIIV